MEKLEKLQKLLKIYKLYKLQKHKKKRRLWSREWLLRRDSRQLGACSFVQNELLYEDIRSYANFLRIDNDLFAKLQNLVESDILKMDTQFRCCIPSKYKLIITLRYLATGETFASLSYSCRVAACTISKFIPEVLTSLYSRLHQKFLPIPSTQEQWKEVAKGFYCEWNIPNTIGAMDGKHIAFRAPRSAGSHYYNYKGSHSIVLLAIVDAYYNFIYIDVGTNGRVSDGGVYEDCDFAVALNQKSLNLPDDTPLPGMRLPVPHVIVADAAFPLQDNILKPYPYKNMSREERIYNYRLSRARRVVENAFGIMTNRFRVLLNPINLSRDKTVLITQTCCALHNFIKMERPNTILQDLDKEDEFGNITPGTWQKQQNIANATYRRGRPSNRSIAIREEFKYYFNNQGKVSWQDASI